MQGWSAEQGCRGSGAGAWGRPGAWGHWYPKLHNLTMADDNLPAKFHHDPFSRFTVSVQFGAKRRSESL